MSIMYLKFLNKRLKKECADQKEYPDQSIVKMLNENRFSWQKWDTDKDFVISATPLHPKVCKQMAEAISKILGTGEGISMTMDIKMNNTTLESTITMQIKFPKQNLVKVYLAQGQAVVEAPKKAGETHSPASLVGTRPGNPAVQSSAAVAKPKEQEGLELASPNNPNVPGPKPLAPQV